MAGNIFDYLEWRGDLSFRQSAFNVVDALILSCLAYNTYPLNENDEKNLEEVFDEWMNLPEEDRFHGIEPMKPCIRLAEETAACTRYRDIIMTRYTEIISSETEEQFGAVTYIIPNGKLLIAYRGTDDTLAGWKEDCNMAFLTGTPAQLEAEAYARRITDEFTDMPIEIAGHSKGGNLAVWAAVNQPEDNLHRIGRIYNFDGPGFRDGLIGREKFTELKGRILSYIPEASIIGMLMGCVDYFTIKSSTLSLLQHDPFTWSISGTDFVYETERAGSSEKIERAINDMINTMKPEDLSEFVDDVYGYLRTNDVDTVADLKKHLLRHVVMTAGKYIKFRSKYKDAKESIELSDAIMQED